MFGNPISTGTYVPGQTTSGSAGYIVQFNLGNQNPHTVTGIQVQDSSAGTVSALVSPAEDQAKVQAYLNDPAAVDLAFYVDGTVAGVFFNATTYPLNSSTSLPDPIFRIMFNYLGMPATVSAVSDANPIPDNFVDLKRAVCQDLAYKQSGQPTPQPIQQKILTLRQKLGI